MMTVTKTYDDDRFPSGRSDEETKGKLVENISHFGRALRRAGFPIGSGQVLEAVRAIIASGLTNREDFYWIMRACLVSKKEQVEVFTQIFRLYWRDPQFLERMMALLVPITRGVHEGQPADAAARRAADALLVDNALSQSSSEHYSEELEIGIDASGTSSSSERLRTLDFEQMTNEEMAEATRIVAALAMDVSPLRSRRKKMCLHGRFVDWRSTMRQTVTVQGEIKEITRRDHQTRWPSLVVLCDISGSMSIYSRTILRFLHAVANRKGSGWSRVHVFTFGTRLTNITRHLLNRDADVALAAAGTKSPDWEGGTRIGDCLRMFNIEWGRRVMGQGTVTLLISDGLDGSGESRLIALEMRRLQMSSRRLIWVNPLLRWDGFLPKARGIREMLPYVDCFRSGHNIVSMEALAESISNTNDWGEKQRLMAYLND